MLMGCGLVTAGVTLEMTRSAPAVRRWHEPGWVLRAVAGTGRCSSPAAPPSARPAARSNAAWPATSPPTPTDYSKAAPHDL